MAITKDKKKSILDKLDGIKNSESIVFVNFKGLPVFETTTMRRELAKGDVAYYVAKKTLVKKAFAEAGIEGDMPQLEGELAVVYGNDATGPAREVFAFQKKFDGKISILGGIFEHKFVDKSQMEEIAKIPSMHVLRGMFVNVINSPIQGFAMAIKAIADKKTA
ncbi:MAG: ribosomal protein large subunit ribosomal protein [Candidatus Parcubacteria bacterium]|jgi:large subunit ribosomal protein L10